MEMINEKQGAQVSPCLRGVYVMTEVQFRSFRFNL